ncbi:MAG: O-antigen ligase family protein [Planctomycetes bacterium]|nr:O-antigen ligase family protein [Planctomycetota bacterium]
MDARRESPFTTFAAFLILVGVSLRLAFSSATASFTGNALADLVVFCGILFYLLANLRAGGEPFRLNLPSAAFAFFVVAYLLAARGSPYGSPAVLPCINLAALGGLFLAVSGRLLQRRDTPRAALFLMGLVIMAAAAAFFQYFYEFPRMLEKVRHLTPPFTRDEIGINISVKQAADFLTRLESREVFATFFTSNVFAGFLALALPVTIGAGAAAVIGQASRRWKIAFTSFSGALAVVEAILVVLTKSKAGLAAAVGGVGLFLVLLVYRLVRRRTFLIILLVAVVAVTVGVFAAWPHAEQFTNEAKTSLGIRLGYWRATWRIIEEAPLSGVGPGNFASHYFKNLHVGEREVQDPHNIWLLVWASGGVFALVFFAAFWILVFAGPKVSGTSPPQPGRLLATAALAGAGLLYAAMLGLEGGLSPAGDLPLAVTVLAGALSGAVVVFFLWPAEGALDLGIIRAGLAAGIAGFLLSATVDVTFSDAGAATAVVFAAAALSPRRKYAVLKPATFQAFVIAGLAVVALLLFVGKVFLPCAQAETALEAARSHFQRGEMAAAERDARTASSLNPKNAAAPALLGDIYFARVSRPGGSSKDLLLAEKFYNKALELDYLYLPALVNRARLYSMAGPRYFSQALNAHMTLLAAYPANSQYNLMAARLLDRHAVHRKALTFYQRALHIDAHVQQHGIQLSPEEHTEITEAIDRLQEKIAAQERNAPR